MAAGLLGILEAVPPICLSHPAYPADRLVYMVEDSGATIRLDDDVLRDAQHVASILESPTRCCCPDDLAYVIYTPPALTGQGRDGAAPVRGEPARVSADPGTLLLG